MASPGIISRLYRSLAPRTRDGTLAATGQQGQTAPPTGRDCLAWSRAIDREIEEVSRAGDAWVVVADRLLALPAQLLIAEIQPAGDEPAQIVLDAGLILRGRRH